MYKERERLRNKKSQREKKLQIFIPSAIIPGS